MEGEMTPNCPLASACTPWHACDHPPTKVKKSKKISAESNKKEVDRKHQENARRNKNSVRKTTKSSILFSFPLHFYLLETSL